MSTERPNRAPFFPAAAGLLSLAALLLLSACVVEERRPSRSTRPLPAPVNPGAPATPGQAPTLPDGPVATPAPSNASRSAALRFAMLPLGTVPFDAQVLPLVSPDGRFMAVEDGDAPSWPTLLAQSDASPAMGTHLKVYDLKVAPLKEVPPAEKPPTGVILGRAADTRGFLVESPRPDGARWIGRCSWVGAKVEWLVQGGAVNAHATLAPDGALAYCTRAVGESRFALVVRDPDGAARTLDTPDVSYALPFFSADGRIVFVPAVTSEGLEFLAIRVALSDGTRPVTLGPAIARRVLAKGGDMALAYQVMAPCQNIPTLGKPHESRAVDDKPPLLYHPGLGRMAAFDWANAAFLPLLPKSIAAVHSPLSENPGYFQTTPSGLMFTPPPVAGAAPDAAPRPEARVMDTAFVPRATTDPQRPLILLGPGQGSRLQVVVFGTPPPGPPPAQ